jgi:hypothetical protein
VSVQNGRRKPDCPRRNKQLGNVLKQNARVDRHNANYLIKSGMSIGSSKDIDWGSPRNDQNNARKASNVQFHNLEDSSCATVSIWVLKCPRLSPIVNIL